MLTAGLWHFGVDGKMATYAALVVGRGPLPVGLQPFLAGLNRIIAAMLFLLSPAKTLDYDTPAGDLPHTRPQFAPHAAELIEVLRKKTPAQVARLMALSDSLASLNVARYQAWSPRFTARNAKQAVLAFNGDVYDGLAARTLRPVDLDWAQEHVCILSGLYGVLRPLDWMQPYRLEMGTALEVGGARNLYQFWDTRIADYLNRAAGRRQDPGGGQPGFPGILQGRRPANPQGPRGRLRVRGMEGRRLQDHQLFGQEARGLMARYAIEHRIDTPRKLQGFDLEGYAFDPGASRADRMVFRRKVNQ